MKLITTGLTGTVWLWGVTLLAQGTPMVRWNPATLSVRIVPGTTLTREVELTSEATLPRFYFEGTGATGPLLVNIPLDPLSAGASIVVPLTFAAAMEQPIGTVAGTARVQFVFLRGDGNGDTEVDIADAVFTLFHLFTDQITPVCADALDANDDGTVDVSDVIYTLWFLFLSGAPVPAPFPLSGVDVSPDALACGLGLDLALEVIVERPTAQHIPVDLYFPLADRISTAPGVGRFVNDEIIVVFEGAVSDEEVTSLAEHLRAGILGADRQAGVYQIQLQEPHSSDDLLGIAAEVEARLPVARAILHGFGVEPQGQSPGRPNDAAYQDAWDENQPAGDNYGLELIQALSAWETVGPCAPCPRVAIIDEGFDARHEDLVPVAFTDGYMGVFATHGTAVAGIVGANRNNGRGIAGVCGQCRLLLYSFGYFKSHSEYVRNDELAISQAMRRALRAEADVINLSGGAANERMRVLCRAVLRDAEQMGSRTVFVFAAGNDGIDAAGTWPAALSLEFSSRVITVAAVNSEGQLSNFRAECNPQAQIGSNWGEVVTVAAPGSCLRTTLPGNAYDPLFFGTSAAAPFVAGLAGLLRSGEPALTAAQVVERIKLGAFQGNKQVIDTEHNCFYVINALKTLQPDDQATGDAPWAMSQHDARRTARAGSAGPERLPKVDSVPFPGKASLGLHAIGQDDTLYASMDGDLASLNPDGSQRWLQTHQFTDLAVGPNGRVYTLNQTADNREINCLNPADGSPVWPLPYRQGGAATSSTSSLLVDGESNVYFLEAGRPGDGNGRLHVLSPDGDDRWTALPPSEVPSEGAVVNTFERGPLAISPDGTVLMLALGGLKFGGAARWFLVAIDGVTHAPRWTVVLGEGGDNFTGAAVDRGGVTYLGNWGFFQTVQSGRLRAFDANGNLLWSMGSTAGNPPAIRADGRPVCSNYSEGRLYEYEPVSGAYQQYPRVADFLSTPITDSLGKVFVIGWQKHLEEGQPTDQPDAATANLYCFDICRGERWRLPMPNAGGLLLGRDRRLYVAASNPAALHILRE